MKTSRIINFVLASILLPCCLQGCTTPVLKEIPACEKQILRTSENGLYLDDSGNVWTWGINDYGGLGVDAEMNRATEAVKVISNVVRIASGSCQNLALDNQGKVWQWGNNNRGAFGDKTETVYYKPVLMFENAIDIYAFADCCFAIKNDGSLWAWGKGAYGTTKKLSETGSLSFAPYKIMDGVVKIKADMLNFGVMKEDGTVWLWGNCDYGQLGNGKIGDGIRGLTDQDYQYTPVKTSIRDVVDFSIGNGFVIAQKKDGTLWGWGNNECGQLGNGKNGDGDTSTIDTVEKKPVKIMDNVSYSIAYYYNAYAIDSEKNLYVWGDNTYGYCADNTTGNIVSPIKTNIRNIPYKAAEDVKAVIPSQVTFIIKQDDSLWGCGLNAASMMGAGIRVKLPRDNAEKDKLAIPYFLKITDNASALSAINFSVSMVKNDGTVWGWGMDTFFEASGTFVNQENSMETIQQNTKNRQEQAMKESPAQLQFSKS